MMAGARRIGWHGAWMILFASLAAVAITCCAMHSGGIEAAWGAARSWKLCGLAAGLGIGAVAFGLTSPLAGVIALAASQVAAMLC